MDNIREGKPSKHDIVCYTAINSIPILTANALSWTPQLCTLPQIFNHPRMSLTPPLLMAWPQPPFRGNFIFYWTMPRLKGFQMLFPGWREARCSRFTKHKNSLIASCPATSTKLDTSHSNDNWIPIDSIASSLGKTKVLVFTNCSRETNQISADTSTVWKSTEDGLLIRPSSKRRTPWIKSMVACSSLWQSRTLVGIQRSKRAPRTMSATSIRIPVVYYLPSAFRFGVAVKRTEDRSLVGVSFILWWRYQIVFLLLLHPRLSTSSVVMEEETTCSILTEAQNGPYSNDGRSCGTTRVRRWASCAAKSRYACSSSRRHSLFGRKKNNGRCSRSGVKYPSQFLCWASLDYYWWLGRKPGDAIVNSYASYNFL